MLRHLRVSIVCLSLFGMGVPQAIAADFGSLKDAPIEVKPSWTGFYFGAAGGFGRNESDNNYRDSTGLTLSNEETSDGGFISTIIGFDRQIRDRFVIGVFADFDISDITRTVSGRGFKDEVTLDRSWAIGGRLGYLVHDNFLVYVTGGYTQAHFDNDGFWDIRTGGAVLRGRDELTFHGYFVGGGIERALGNDFYLRGELRYSDYDGETINSGTFAGTTYVDVEVPEVYSARVGLTYKIGRHNNPHNSHGYSGEDEYKTYKVVSYKGVDVSKDAWFLYSGLFFALNGDFDKDGVIFRTQGVYGQYDYDTGGAPNVEIEATDRTGDVMLGYQIVGKKISAIGFVGYEVRDIDLEPDDVTNRLRGTEDGVKVALEVESHQDVPWYMAISASYSTAFAAYKSQLRLGWNKTKYVVGLEGELLGDEEDDAQRIGAFSIFRFNLSPSMPAELTINGGYQFVDSGSTGGGAGAANVSSSSGGEGGYFGSALGVAF